MDADNSYGFRPGRSCHDAIEAIFTSIRFKPKYVLDADIGKCFDKINQKKLLDKLNTFPKLRKQIRAWLKAGFFDKGSWFSTDEGTLQGGVCSPLLANIALNGMEEKVKEYAETLKGKKVENRKALQLIRYADDFVIMHEDREVILKCREIIGQFLGDIGLKFSEEKTNITHTLNEEKGKCGFDFLGFSIRQYKHGKHTCGKTPLGVLKGFKTIIKPSEKSIKRHYRELAKIINQKKASTQEALVGELNSKIRGWCNYYSKCCANDGFSKIVFQLFWKLKRWGLHRHPNKGSQWINKKYWHKRGGNNWVFGNENCELIDHRYTEIKRHTKVRGESSPYDGNLNYWATRLGKHPKMKTSVTKLLKKQKGKCTECGLVFIEGDLREIDHILPKSQGGKEKYSNLQLLHRHCHDRKTTRNFSANDNSQVTEEPCEVKVSRTVLKTSRNREVSA
ncbi:MAG: group II intron reverse transcriptase/maturase [Moorea sp. SIO2B7]|nr:group II intron reverse transcriptase/maturase [Moorena sp. SIO2B7]